MEVAHDIQLQVSKFVTQELKVLNSFDTWHGKIWMLSCTCILLWFKVLSRYQECGQRARQDHTGQGEGSRHDLVPRTCGQA